LSQKSQQILQELTPGDKQMLRELSKCKRGDFLVRLFGNDSEKIGIRFALYPLWTNEVLTELGLDQKV